MHKPVKILLLFVAIFANTAVQAKLFLPQNYSASRISAVQNQSEVQRMLIENARHYYYFSGDKLKADSAAFLALKYAENQSTAMQAAASQAMRTYGNLQLHKAYATEFARKLVLSESEVAQWEGYTLLSAIAQSNYKFGDSKKYALDAATKARLIKRQDLLGLSHMQLANALNGLHSKLQALNNYLIAQDMLRKGHFVYESFLLNNQLIDFYIYTAEPDRALELLEAQRKLLGTDARIDSLDALNIVWVGHYLQYVASIERNRAFNDTEVYNQLRFCMANNLNHFKKNYISLLRSFFITKNNFAALKRLYVSDLPDEYARIKSEDKPLYFRMQAYFFELDNNIDSAKANWQKTFAATSETDKNLLANAHIRYGEFLQRIGQTDEAEIAYKKAYDLAAAAGTLAFLENASELLEGINLANGNFELAYHYAEKRHLFKDSLAQMNENEKLKLAKVVHDNRIKQAESEEKIKSQSRTTKILLVGLILVLMLSAFAYYLYRQTRWQKQRSDELLLNILPEETANELREKGHTIARRYNNATVLFADIVGFSSVAEGLEPRELVARIDAYFRAFDSIMAELGLEKIKTIGDAYVAVAGLPAGNKATAVDAVAAALRMHSEVEKINTNYQNNPLQLRIGLNSGDVVAGVVGIKKFQFDIWGDAVNVAARMEQHSAPGRVNISESTYQQVNQVYRCEYRGNIAAKNMGELAMYFVNETKAV